VTLVIWFGSADHHLKPEKPRISVRTMGVGEQQTPGVRVMEMAAGDGVHAGAGGLAAITKTWFGLIFEILSLPQETLSGERRGYCKRNIPEDWGETGK